MTKIFRVSPENPEGILVDLTAEEEAQRQTDISAETARQEAEPIKYLSGAARQEAEADAKVAQDAVDAQKATDKGTGNQKLLDLGLTQAEVDALTGH